MYKQLQNFIDSALGMRSNRLIDNMSDAEVRRNTIQFLGILILLGLVIITMQMLGHHAIGYASMVLNAVWAGSYIAAIVVVYLVNLNKAWCVRVSLLIVLFEGAIAIVRWLVYKEQSPGDATVIGVMLGLILGALFLPWSPKQTMLVSGIWILGAVSSLFFTKHSEDFSVAAAIFVYIVVTVPGTMISFFRMSRFQDQLDLHFIKSQYEDVRQELQAAKNIHERGFPKPKSSGLIRFTYIYRPMSQIGGDSIFASIEHPCDPDTPVTLVLFDVTGHGLSAALTANRLQGELMRLTGENPRIDPGEILTQLDRYVCLTLADAAVLVSAVAIRTDPAQRTIHVANAGHPSPVLRNARGATVQIRSSCPVLGVGVGSGIEPIVEEHPFLVGDSMIAFTDGVSEAVDAKGELYNEQGVIDVLEGDWIDESIRWPEKILIDVEKKRAGSAADDILIVELYRA